MTPDLYLHVTTKGADRALIVGESGTGKSTLAKRLVEHFHREYWPKCRILIADTKPRWRATRVLTGDSVAKRYVNMVEGDEIDAVLLDNRAQWKLAWDPRVNPSRTVMLQPDIRKHYDEDSVIAWQVGCISQYFRTLKPSIPSLLYIDEGMDFFGPNGYAKQGDIIQRCYRAGRERGLVTVMAVQRPACITVQAMSESNVKYLFALGSDDDFLKLRKLGLPRDVRPVEEDYLFRMIRNRKLYPKLLTLKGAA